MKSQNSFPVDALKGWFLKNARPLPWREHRTPYRVWISEVMLQQTQVSVAIPYFDRWMESFPSISALAAAPLDAVMKVWEGLGYYGRARNLHRAAKFFQSHCGGRIPPDETILSKVPGFGPYTIGALLSFAFHRKHPAVDGNVLRVISRFYGFLDYVDKPAVVRQIREHIASFLPKRNHWLITEGMIELGALICTKEPKCYKCPINSTCYANTHAMQTQLPRKKSPQPITQLIRIVGVIFHQGAFLVNQAEEGRVMSGLFEFPYFESHGASSPDEAALHFSRLLKIPLRVIHPLSVQSHSFTRFRARLIPFLLESKEPGQYSWIAREELAKHPFSAGHKRILQEVLNL